MKGYCDRCGHKTGKHILVRDRTNVISTGLRSEKKRLKVMCLESRGNRNCMCDYLPKVPKKPTAQMFAKIISR